DFSRSNVFPRRHLIANEVLKNDSDFAIKIFQVVLAKIHSVEQDFPFRRVVKSSNELDDGGLALPIFANERYALSWMQVKIQAIYHQAAGSRIAKRHIAKFKSLLNRPRSAQRIWFRVNRRFHLEKCEQIGQEQCLI